jgi:hypothetical protein
LPTPSARCTAPSAVIPQNERARFVRVLVATRVTPSACAPLFPMSPLYLRLSVARDALFRTPSDRFAAPAAVLPSYQYSRCRLVRVLLSTSARPSSRKWSCPMEVCESLSSVRAVPLSRSRRILSSQECTSSGRMLGAFKLETAAAVPPLP